MKISRNLKSIIILVSVCVCLAVVYFLVTANENPAAAGVLYRLNGDSIEKIALDNQYGSFSFEKQDGVWMVNSNGTYRTNPQKIDLLLGCLEEFEIDRMLPEEKSDYGFDSPSAQVSVTTGSGKQYSFTVGSEAIKGVSVYVKSGDDIMLTSTGMTSQLTGSLAAYRCKDVLKVDPSSIRSIDYYVNGEKTLSLSNQDYQHWTLQYPFEAPARRVVLNEMISRLRSLAIAGYIDSGNAKTDMGLDNAAGKMVLTDEAGVQQTLEFGMTDGTMQYVRIGSKEDIVQLYASDLDFSDLTPEGVMYIAPLNIGTEQVQSLAITSGDNTDTIVLKHDGSNFTASLNGSAMSESDFTSVYYKYIALNADLFDKQEATPKDCMATLTTTLTDGTKTELSLFERDADTLYMVVNGELLKDGQTVFYTKKSSLDELIYRLQSVKGE